jgi:hypothetical protein
MNSALKVRYVDRTIASAMLSEGVRNRLRNALLEDTTLYGNPPSKKPNEIGDVLANIEDDNCQKMREVAIKIQYPGVAASIDSDITLLKGAINSLLLLARKKMDLDPLFSELRVVFKNETDYELELKNLIQYKENLKKYLEKNILAGEVVITLGAGNIYDIYHELETDVPVLVATETLVK